VLELAKTLAQSSTYTIQSPNTGLQPTPKKGKGNKAKKPPEPDNKPLTHATTLPGDAPVLPPGTYTITPSLVAPKLSYTEAYEMELALAAKQKALEDCSEMIDSAVEELQKMAEAGDRFWSQVRTLKNGTKGKDQWAIVPRPDFGRIMVEGEKARDVIIPYAVDEGKVILREHHSCLKLHQD